MATKQYRLLRSNKESGPYTAGELIEMGLKPYDLVWLDGRSAAWRYPGEMEEFKAYAPLVEEQPFERFFKKNNSKANNGGSVTQPALQTEAAAVVTAPKNKPRIRIKADWSQVPQPAVENLQTVVAVQAATAPQQQAKQTAAGQTPWQDAWLNWQQEQNATKGTPNTNGLATAKFVQGETEEPVINTKFSQSLDSLKQQYANTVLKPKNKTTGSRKYKGAAVIALLAIPVLGFGVWLGGGLQNNAGDKTSAASILPVATAANVQNADSDSQAQAGIVVNTHQTIVPKRSATAKEVIPELEENAAGPAAPATKKKPVAPLHTQAVTAAKKTAGQLQQPAAAQGQQKLVADTKQQYAFTPPVDAEPGARNKVINPALAGAANNTAVNGSSKPNQNRQPEIPATYTEQKKGAEAGAPVFTHYTKQQKTEDYVSVDADEPASQNVQNLALNVQNVTDAPVDLVVIDVQYYDAYGKFKSGQTIYVKNIPVDKTIKVKVPDNLNANKIKYRVSLVSVEQKGVYLVAE